MSNSPLKVVYLTAGAGGMYCGSCMHDNTLARAMIAAGVDMLLVPLYTPIRTDEQDVSVGRVFFGGINVYLQQKFSLFRYLPRLFDRFFDQKWLLRWATSKQVDAGAEQLGELAVSMLRGEQGHQRKEVRRLCKWLRDSIKPNLINLSNMLIAGCVPALKKQLGVPVLVTLQGDDVFLDELPEPHKSQAFDEIRRLADDVDGFITHSRYYADFMAGYLGVPRDKFHITPLAIDTTDFAPFAACDRTHDNHRAPAVGYLARLAPEKGLHVLVDAFLDLRARPGTEHVQLRVAGWLGQKNRPYADEQFAKLKAAGLSDAFHYAGEVDRAGKIDFLRNIDVLSVPTVYHDPKGLFVLEALAAGVPVVQPEHGAFPELLSACGGGRLVRPEDPKHLAETLHTLLTDHPTRDQLARIGCQAVHQRYDSKAMAAAMLKIYGSFQS